MLRRLGQPAVLLRLAVAWLTALAVTILAAHWGPPLPFRAGESYPYDLRARIDFEMVGSSLEKYPHGVILVPCGQSISERQIEVLEYEHEAYQDSLGTPERWKRGCALFLIFSLLTTLVVLYVSRFQIAMGQSLPMICGVCVLVLATLVTGMYLSQAPWHAVILPMTITAMVLTLAYNPQFAAAHVVQSVFRHGRRAGRQGGKLAGANGGPGRGDFTVAPCADQNAPGPGRLRSGAGLPGDDPGHGTS